MRKHWGLRTFYVISTEVLHNAIEVFCKQNGGRMADFVGEKMIYKPQKAVFGKRRKRCGMRNLIVILPVLCYYLTNKRKI